MSAGTRLHQLRRNWRTISVAVILAGLSINAWAQAGTAVVLLLAGAAVGCALAVLAPAYVAGWRVVRHAQAPARQLEAAAARRVVEQVEHTSAQRAAGGAAPTREQRERAPERIPAEVRRAPSGGGRPW